MRIVYLHQYFVTPSMAGGSRSYEMARRLVSYGHEVHMVTSDQSSNSANARWRRTIEEGIVVHWTPVRYDNSLGYSERVLAFLKFAWRAARKAAEIRADVVYATSTPLTIAIPAVYAARRSRAPMVFEVRDLWPAVPIAIGAIRNPVLKAGARWLERFAYRNAAHVVALAPGMRDEIVATGYPPDRISIIPNGCDFEYFVDTGAGDQVRVRHEWLANRPLLVFAGTFGPVNGMDYLVHLAAEIAKIEPEIRVAAVGTGREFERVRRLGADMGVLDRNLFLLGQLPKRDAMAWVQAADMTIALFAGPEIVWRDAVQNKFFDSLAAGKPVASNFAGWQSKVAAEANAGLILSAGDVSVAAGDIVRALADRDWMTRAGLAARALAEHRFDRERLGARLTEVLEAVYAESR